MPSTTAPTLTSSPPLRRRGAIALLVVFALIWFANLDFRRLVHPDEGRYAEIPREMVSSGDWVTPRLNGIKYFEKPALQYWLTAAAYEAFGVREWTARLWPALAGFLGVFVVGYAGARLGGSGLGLAGAAVLVGSIGYTLEAHILTLDAGLALWMSIALGSLFMAQRDDATPGGTRAWMWTSWVAVALATLSKGLIGIVLPGGALIIYSLLTRDWPVWRRLHIFSGALIFLVVTVPWFLAVSLRNPEFFDFFFIHEHFTRFLTTEHHRQGAWWYFIPILALGILPWITLLGLTAIRMWTDAPTAANGFNWQRFALVWSVFIFVFFSASGSKLPSYILPMFPALALLIGWQWTRLDDAQLARLFAPLVVLMGALTFAMLFGYERMAGRIAEERQPLAPLLAYGPWIKVACTIAFVLGVAAWWWLTRRQRTLALLALALASLIFVQLVTTGYDELAESRSSEPVLSRVVAMHGPLLEDVPFYSIRMYDQTLPYYLGRTVVLVAHADELAPGIATEPDKAIATIGEWRRRWESADQAYAMMQPDQYEKLLRDGVPMVELGRDPRRVVVSRR
jgi:4-amino-4-deoxy-L-arabinose transferase-like glycosyltransferase